MDDDQPATTAKKTVMLFGRDLEITDPRAVQPIWVDAITELRTVDGVVLVGLGAITFDGTGPAEVQVQARLRIPLTTVGDIQRGIETVLGQAEEAKKAAN